VNTTVIEPKIIADPLVNSDALSYH